VGHFRENNKPYPHDFGAWAIIIMEIVTRKYAIENGLTRYFTGEPCKNGNIEQRSTRGRLCARCSREKAVKDYEKRKDYFTIQNQSEKSKAAKKKYSELESTKEKQRISAKNLYHKNIEKFRKNAMRKYHAMTEEQKNNMRATRKKKRESCDVTRCISTMRCMLNRYFVFTGEKKAKRTEELLGYSAAQLKAHLEKMFIGKMNWDNHGELWEIDHIIPISVLVKNGERDPSKINCLSNLKPILKTENRSKQDKVLTLL